LRSTQFIDESLFSEAPEEHRGRSRRDTLCERIRRLGYAKDNQVQLYGEIFELLSDPFSIGDNLVFVDARERKTGRLRRVRIPLTITKMAQQERRAA
jgi:hypothetical protein